MSSIFEKILKNFSLFFKTYFCNRKKRPFSPANIIMRARARSRARKSAKQQRKKTSYPRLFFFTHQQPLQFLQFPEHFLLGFPVAEYIVPV